VYNESLLEGNKNFVENKTPEIEELLVDFTVNGQNPKALFIACCDSRVTPNIITNAGHGELFIARNIGNFVPPYDESNGYLAVASAVEYASSALEVTDIIVCGHSHCGAIAASYKQDSLDSKKFAYTKKWLTLASKAHEEVAKKIDENTSEREKLTMTEKASAVFQLDNLMTYPAIKERVEAGTLQLNAWYYDIQSGEVSCYDKESGEFIKK